MQKLIKSPLFYINLILLGAFFLLVTSINVNQTNLPSFLKKAIAAVQAITGEGGVGYLSAFTATNQIGNSIIYDTGTRIGIGTTAPNSILDARHNTEAPINWGNSTNAVGFLGHNGNDALVGARGAVGGSLVLRAGSNDRMIFSSNIGPEATAYWLNDVGVKVGFLGYNGNDALIGDYAGTGGSLRLRAGNADRVFISSNGNVGIGTNTPGQKLTIGAVGGIEVQDGTITVKSAYTPGALTLYGRDIRTSAEQDLYLNWSNDSKNIVIGGEGEQKVIYMAGTNSYVDANDYFIRSKNKWASQLISGCTISNQCVIVDHMYDFDNYHTTSCDYANNYVQVGMRGKPNNTDREVTGINCCKMICQ